MVDRWTERSSTSILAWNKQFDVENMQQYI